MKAILIMSNFKNPEAETMSTILFLHVSSLAITIYSSFIHNLFQIIIIKKIKINPPTVIIQMVWPKHHSVSFNSSFRLIYKKAE